MKRLIALLFVLSLTACSSNQGPMGQVEPTRAAEINAELGLRYMIQGKYELALEKLDKAIEYNPDLAEAHHYKAELYRRLDKPKTADREYRRALDLAPDDSSIHNNYGVFLCGEAHRYEAGIQQFLQVLNNPVYPQRAQVYENLGLCTLRIPDKAKAEQYFRKALEINPRMAKSLFSMAQLSFEDKNYLSARAYLQRYHAIAPRTPQTLWLGIRIERHLGGDDAVASYGMLLLAKFPDSDEAQLYKASQKE